MFKNFLLTGVFLAMVFLPSPAQAVFIVDTGAPGVGLPGWNLEQGFQEGVAGAFDIDQAYVIDGIQGWFQDSAGSIIILSPALPFNGTVTLSLYGAAKDFANGDIPDITKKFYTTEFNVSPGTGANWYGASGLDWSLTDPGKYFAAFELLSGNTCGGYLPFPAPTVINGASRQSKSDDYLSIVGIGIGLRVDARTPPVSAVPEPISMLLFGTGCLGMAALRKI